jgi:hypothetical protein
LSWLLVFAIASILVGLLLLVSAYMPRPAHAAARVDPARELARVRHQLGLAHRLFARLVGVPRSGLEDDGFGAVAELYLLSRPYARLPLFTGALLAGEPLLEIEQLVERLESFSARARSWRPRGRARGLA